MSTAASSSNLPARQLGFGPLLTTIFQAQLLSLARSRKTIILAVVALLPVVAAIVYLVRGNTSGLVFYRGMLEQVFITFLLPMIALFYGGPAVVEEIEGRTLIYLFLRPVAKPAIFLGKTAAATVMTIALTLIPVTLFYTIALSAGDSPADHLQLLAQNAVSLLVGCVSYTVIFATLGAIFARSLLAGLVFWGAVEWFGSFVPVVKYATQNFHIRNAGSLVDVNTLTQLEQFVLNKPIVIHISVSYAFLGATIAIALTLGAWVFNTREYPV
ncbi:MAG: ABC transporter permease [Myxococcota bacterium]